jgi:ATP-dependent RNA helicase DDX5/DBP2
MDTADELAQQEAEAKAAADTPAVSYEEYRKQNQIKISGSDASGKKPYAPPNPVLTFGGAPFSASIKSTLKAAGFSAPTPTQAQSWPIALQGRDLISVAKTGSGKTLGFLLPAFHRMQAAATAATAAGAKPKAKGPSILVMAPTRELACQIFEESKKFGRLANIRSCCLYGGAPKWPQIQSILTDPEVCISTPGRLNDIIAMGKISLANVKFLVLDEVSILFFFTGYTDCVTSVTFGSSVVLVVS